ncbi:TetR/AcrR family transcriptional regulator [Paenibacillus sp. CAA11]|uniref:TetR/AcrR family transcriptional regulator n=1 Tax=Paenibacillus sp. CAA11 TaxID=1532905 RepID=UPI000D37C640|nr:TetR/AcrR family transcriptional regulator [Paenibacillus sp. CAA11]AWB45528.1 TetR/AcrR family transcriptional regulator [Paenibacillus sp. CAA11]
MSMLKEKIIQSAIRLFTEKGFQATSIQDIADDCSIAKGSLYKHFASKDELYIQILQRRQQSMMAAVEQIRQKQLPARETYLEEIACQIEFYIEHGYYIARDHNELTSLNKDTVGAMLNQFRKEMFRYYQDILNRHYGAEVSAWKWDVTAVFCGLIREYTFHLLFGYKPLDCGVLAVFIAERMDDLVAGLSKRKTIPLLTDDLMAEYAQTEMKSLQEVHEIRRTGLFEAMRSMIPDIAAPNARKSDLSGVLELLQAEINKEQPRAFLIHALLRDLGSEVELASYVHQLQPLVLGSR